MYGSVILMYQVGFSVLNGGIVFAGRQTARLAARPAGAVRARAPGAGPGVDAGRRGPDLGRTRCANARRRGEPGGGVPHQPSPSLSRKGHETCRVR